MLRLVFLFALLAPLPAAADVICDDLWMSRNTLYDQAGQCFQTRLGRSIFDNSDCTTNRAVLSPEEGDIVTLISRQEDALDCKIDTARRTLEISLVDQRLSLRDVPVARREEAKCGGYRGNDIPLRLGADENTPSFQEIKAGLSVVFGHLSPYPGWDFVTVMDPFLRPVGLGWIETRSDWFTICEKLVG